jgi:hypothetical protein
MKTYWGIEFASLTYAVDEYEWSDSCPSRFNSGERAPDMY